jgi:hypothetical protein
LMLAIGLRFNRFLDTIGPNAERRTGVEDEFAADTAGSD